VRGLSQAVDWPVGSLPSEVAPFTKLDMGLWASQNCFWSARKCQTPSRRRLREQERPQLHYPPAINDLELPVIFPEATP